MARVVLGLTISLDGFINDRNGSVDRLYPDLADLRTYAPVQEAMARTGAVVTGRRAYNMGNGDFTDYEFQVPIFMVTHHPPGAGSQRGERSPALYLRHGRGGVRHRPG